MTRPAPSAAASLAALRDRLASTTLLLPLDGAVAASRLRDAALRQIDDYIAPRLDHPDAPLLAVMGGSTGAGKSTLVNTLTGRIVSRSSAIRPTTREPVLLHSPADRDWFTGPRILPGLERVRGPVAPGSRPGSVALIEDARLPSGLALLDAPDIDSVSEENRALAAKLLAAADLWVFVTTANRYADAVPWQLLDEAGRREMTLAVVLDRLPPGAGVQIEPDLHRMLADHGLDGTPVFSIPESPLDSEGLLPDDLVAPIREWLHDIAEDRRHRADVARRTVLGAVRELQQTSDTVTAARAAQLAAADAFALIAEQAYADANRAVTAATSDGVLLRGEVLARWQDFVGTGDLFRGLEGWVGRTRDRVAGWFQGRPADAHRVETELATGLHAVVLDAAGTAAAETWRRWRQQPGAAPLLHDPSLALESEDVSERAAALVRDWRGAILELVREQAGPRRARARVLSLGLNAVTVALMVVVFATTAGLTGGEIAIAGGSAVIGQKLLEAVFGDDAVRRLARQARDDLDRRVAALFDTERERYDAQLDPVREGHDPAVISAAVHELDSALRAGTTS